MTIKRVTFSMPEGLARKMQKAAGKQPISAWLTELVEERLQDDELDQLWNDFYARVSPTRADEKRAAATLARLTRPRRRRAA